MNLPLLPSGKIIETYYLLKDTKPELLHSDNERVRNLFRYYEKYWLRKIGPIRLLVFQKEKRTTNDLKSFHANLKRKFRSHNPNFGEFINKLNEIILSTEKDMKRIINGLPIRRSSIKSSTLQRNLTLEILQRKLLIGEITPLNYVKRICPNFQLEFQTLDYSTFLANANDSEVEAESQSDGEISSHSINTNENEAEP